MPRRCRVPRSRARRDLRSPIFLQSVPLAWDPVHVIQSESTVFGSGAGSKPVCGYIARNDRHRPHRERCRGFGGRKSFGCTGTFSTRLPFRRPSRQPPGQIPARASAAATSARRECRRCAAWCTGGVRESVGTHTDPPAHRSGSPSRAPARVSRRRRARTCRRFRSTAPPQASRARPHFRDRNDRRLRINHAVHDHESERGRIPSSSAGATNPRRVAGEPTNEAGSVVVATTDARLSDANSVVSPAPASSSVAELASCGLPSVKSPVPQTAKRAEAPGLQQRRWMRLPRPRRSARQRAATEPGADRVCAQPHPLVHWGHGCARVRERHSA